MKVKLSVRATDKVYTRSRFHPNNKSWYTWALYPLRKMSLNIEDPSQIYGYLIHRLEDMNLVKT